MNSNLSHFTHLLCTFLTAITILSHSKTWDRVDIAHQAIAALCSPLTKTLFSATVSNTIWYGEALSTKDDKNETFIQPKV